MIKNKYNDIINIGRDNMKKIMIDLDDTIVTGGFLKIVNSYLNTNHTLDDVKEYYIESLLPEGITKDYVKYFYNHDVYDYAEIFTDAKEVIEKLSKKYDVCICSSYVWNDGLEDSYIHLANKYKYLVKEFPFLDPKSFIFTSRKDLIACDIKIDDSIDNLKGDCEKILFTAYHNKNVTENELTKLGIKRVNNWKEIEKLLLGD